MTKNLLATTALITLFATSAFAQDTNVDADVSTDLETEITEGVDVDASMDTSTEGTMDTGVQGEMDQNNVLASDFIGLSVYSSAEAEADAYGDINDVVMDQEGNAEWVIVGVGGFLGLGEKEVALSADQFNLVERDGEWIVVTNVTKAELESAEAFDRAKLEADGTYGTDAYSWTDEGKARLDESKQMSMETETDMSAETDMATDTDMSADTDMNADVDAEADANATMDAPAEMNADSDMSTDARMAWEGEGWVMVENAELSAEDLTGTRVYGPGSEDLGEISDVILTSEGEVTAYIVDVGGFLGLGEKPVALSNQEVQIFTNENGDLRVLSDFTKETLEAGPTYSKDEYEANPDNVVIQ